MFDGPRWEGRLKRTTAVATITAGCAAAAALAYATLPVLRAEEMPPIHVRCVTDIWPESDIGRLEIGASFQEKVSSVFKRLPPPRVSQRRCVAFEYDDELVEEPPLFLTLLVVEGKITNRRLEKVPFSSGFCAGLPHDVVSLKGYFHAQSCGESQ